MTSIIPDFRDRHCNPPVLTAGSTSTTYTSIFFSKHPHHNGQYVMFCKEDRCGRFGSLGRRLKVGGYKMIDVFSVLIFN